MLESYFSSDKYPMECRPFSSDTFPTPGTISFFVELLVGEKLGTYLELFVYFSPFLLSFSNASDVKIVLRYPSVMLDISQSVDRSILWRGNLNNSRHPKKGRRHVWRMGEGSGDNQNVTWTWKSYVYFVKWKMLRQSWRWRTIILSPYVTLGLEATKKLSGILCNQTWWLMTILW